MDYQPMGQTPNPVQNQTPPPTMNPIPQSSQTNGIWYVVIALVVIALGLWYFYGSKASTTSTEPTAVEQTQIPALTSGNTTANISADLNQITDTSSALDADAAASAAAVSGF